jgi:nucleoside-diphosphate-sugar epimerase
MLVHVKALVTGGAGFIGSNLAAALVEAGDAVRILDNFSTGHRSNLDGLEVDLVEGDVRSYERVSTAVRGMDVVFHEAALPSVPRSVQDPLTTTDVNVTGTLNVLLAARDSGVGRVVVASSSSVYGDAPGMPRVEAQATQPMSPYAVSKLACEQFCLAAHRVYGLETVALRYFNVFGENQDPFSGYAAVIPKFIRQMLDGDAPTVFGNGETSRDFTHVENVVSANLRAGALVAAPGRVFNVALGQRHTLNQLVGILNELLETDYEPTYGDPRPGDVPESMADITLARRVLEYEPAVDFIEGLRRTIAWVAQHQTTATLA